MTKLTTLVITLLFANLTAFAASPDAPGGDTGKEQHQGHRKGDFYPKKPADKSLSNRPEKVELVEPKALAQVPAGTVVLKWNESQGADSYRLQVATDPNFKWLVLQEDLFKGTSYEVKNLEAGQQYFWRVYGLRPQNEAGHSSSFASQSSFETK